MGKPSRAFWEYCRITDVHSMVAAPGMSGHAHLLVDQQRYFCDPVYKGNKRTHETAERNVRLVEIFRRLGVTNYLIYTSVYPLSSLSSVDQSSKLYLVQPEDGCDITVRKRWESAFINPDLQGHLVERRQKTLWVTGFNTCACVFGTAEWGSLAGYQVNVITTNTACSETHKEGCSERAIGEFEQMKIVTYTMEEAADYLQLLHAA